MKICAILIVLTISVFYSCESCPPSINVEPNAIIVDIVPGDSVEVEIIISNQGCSTLTWSSSVVCSCPDSVCAILDCDSGELQSNETITCTAVVYDVHGCGDDTTAFIQIVSNDTTNSLIDIPVIVQTP